MTDRDSPTDSSGDPSSEDLTLGLEKPKASSVAAPPPIPGYRDIRLLGQGGMGRVYLARDEFLDRPVAIKVISESLPREAEPVARFQREARAMAAIEHPHIVHIYSYGIADGRPYFVMQFIEGENLAQRTARLGKVSLDDAVHFSLQIVDALEAAWKQDIVHRDLKPANILIDANDNAYVADFGLAMAIRSSVGSSGDDRGKFLGTPRYMAPEQARGLDVDFRADLYSLGLILYELLAGKAPFDGPRPLDMLTQRLNEPIPSIRPIRPDLPIEAERLVTWLTARERELRPRSHEELRLKLEAIQTGRPSLESCSLQAPEQVSSDGLEGGLGAHPLEAGSSANKAFSAALEIKHATVLCIAVVAGGQQHRDSGAAPHPGANPELLQTVGTAIRQHGGEMAKCDGGTLTAVFGFPTAVEGSPIAAIHAAVAVRELADSSAATDETGARFQLRIGVETGSVVGNAQDAGSGSGFSLSGDAVETAAALCSASQDGQILVGQNALRLTQGTYVSAGTRRVRDPSTGLEIEACALASTGVRGHRADAGKRRVSSTKLIGRDSEIDRLGLHVLELLSGKGAIVSIVGPAGIGKSRLLREVKRSYSDRNVAILEGRANSAGASLSFHPLVDLLKSWTRISDHDSNADAIHKLETAIATVHPTEAAEVFPFVATVMGLKLPGAHAARVAAIEGQNLRQLIFKSIRTLLVAAAQAQPLVLILEDLHWADQTSLEFLESLYGLAMSHRILFINLYRPGFVDSTERLEGVLKGTLGPFHDEIVLQPLDAQACEVILSDLLQTSDLPSRVKKHLIHRSDGNPFFLEEIIQSLLDEGKLRIVRGELKGTVDVETLEVPETIQDVLQARLDCLDPTSRRVIRIASVIGRTFLHSVITDVAADVDRLDDRLLYLEHLGMIRRRQHLGELAFSFRHALMQDVAYGSLPGDDRRTLHLGIAQSIERMFSNRQSEFFGMLAYHYCAAEELEKSEEYLIKAGQEAQQAAGSSEALRLFQRALAMYRKRRDSIADSAAIAHLEANVALALFHHGRYGESIECFRKVLPAFGIRPPRSEISLAFRFIESFLAFVVTVHLPSLRFRRHPTPADSEGIQLYYKTLAGLAHHDPKRFFLESFVLAKRLAMFDLAQVDNGVGMFVSAGNLLSWTGVSLSLSERVLRLLEPRVDRTDPKAVISYEAAKITHDFLAGNWSSTACDETLVQRALALGETFLTANYVIFHGRMALEQGRFEDALAMAAKLESMGVEYDHSYPPALHVYLHAKALLKMRRLPEAVSECDKGVRVAEQAALETVVYGLGALKARAQAFMGDLEAAEATLQDVAQSSSGTRLPKSYLGDYLISRSTIDVMRLDRTANRGADVAPKTLVTQAENSTAKLLRNSSKVASHQVEAHRLAGLAAWLEGQHREAARRWLRGVQIGERLGADLDLSRLCWEIGTRFQRAGEQHATLMPRAPEEYLDQARSWFLAMHLEWDLAES